jgi:hypothetical protein
MMKKTMLILAAVLAFSGAAFAGTAHHKHASTGTCVDVRTNVKLDCRATGSIGKDGAATHQGWTNSDGSRVGIAIDPWIVPNIF